MKKYFAIFMARNKEFFKDRGTLLWVIFFPIILIFGFAITFSGPERPLFKVGVIGETPSNDDFFDLNHINFITYTNAEKARQKLRHHQIDLLIDINEKHYLINTDSSNGYIIEKLLLGSKKELPYSQKTITGRAIRYVDWVFPGILAMNIMMNSLFGVGFIIVRYRKNGVLKRLKATPLNSFQFILAQISSRFFIVITINTLVFLGCNLFLKFIIIGSLLDMLIIAALGAFCHIALGLLFACRIRSEELASGLINIFTWPMMLLSGIWFSLEGSPKFLQNIANFIPLTHFVQAVRKVMLDGETLMNVSLHLSVLGATAVLFLIIGSFMFSWEPD